jgi:hypothetical protein
MWWPLIGKAVSGPLKEVRLLEMDKTKWKDIRWKQVKNNYPNALILKSGQDYERPEEWERIDDVSYIKKNYTAK